MSFDFNVLSTKPVIREAASMNNDGGGGNLGYMQRDRDGTKDKKRNLDESIFSKKDEDLFISEKDAEIMEETNFYINLIKKTVSAIKKIFIK